MYCKYFNLKIESYNHKFFQGKRNLLVGQRARLQLSAEMAFEQGELHAATSVERAITASLELTSKLLGHDRPAP